MVRLASRVLIGLLVTWITVVTLVPGYLLFTGRYSLVQSQPRGGAEGDTTSLIRINRVGGEDEREEEREEEGVHHFKPHDPSLRAEVMRLLSVDSTDSSRAAFNQVVTLSSLLPKITNVSRMRTPSSETFRNYIAPVGLPVIFTDMLQGQLLGRWTWEYVQGRWGDTVFHNTRQGNYSTKVTAGGKHFIHRVNVKLSDFIDVVLGRRQPTAGEEGLYITKQRVIPQEDLESEFYYPPFYPGPHKNCYLEPTGW